jgi:hypothetical protein
MAVQPNIALQGQGLNVLGAIQGGQEVAEGIKTQGIREAMLNQQQANTVLESQLLNRRITQADQQIAEAKQQNTAAQNLVMNQLFKELKSSPISQRAGIAARAVPTLKGFGVDENVIGQMDVSDSGLDEAIAATNAFMSQSQGGKSFGATTTIQKDDGSYVRLTEVRDSGTGTVELVETPIQGELVTSAGETTGERIDRELTVAEAKADIKTDQAVAQEEAIREAKLTTAQALTDIATKAKRNEAFSAKEIARIDDAIEKGMAAASSLPDIDRGLELLQTVKTGGLTANAKAITDFFGTTSGDVGELNNILAENVLAGLSAFTGAISEGERAFIEKMNTSLTQGTGFNIAQLNRLRSIYKREVDNGMKAAEIADDGFAIKIFEDAIKADPSGFAGSVAEKAQSNIDFVNGL